MARRGPKQKRLDVWYLNDSYAQEQHEKKRRSSAAFSDTMETLLEQAGSASGISPTKKLACLLLECNTVPEAMDIAARLECISHLHTDIQRKILDLICPELSDINAKYSEAFSGAGISDPKNPSVLCPPIAHCVDCGKLLCYRTHSQVRVWSSQTPVLRPKITLACRTCGLTFSPTRFTSANLSTVRYYDDNQLLVEGNGSNYFTVEFLSIFSNLQ